MSRDERFNTPSEIIRTFPKVRDEMKNASPTIYHRNGVDYYDNSEGHIAIVGRTGTGKSNTTAGSLGTLRNIAKANENIVMVDPKGEGISKYGNLLLKRGYIVYYINFENPSNSPASWNPLAYIRNLYKSTNTDENDFAATMLNELAKSIYPNNKNADPFWTDSAAEFFIGCVYALFELAEENEINLNSVTKMIQRADEKIGASSYIKEFYNILDDDSMAKRYLATYVNAPNDTRMSIFSVAKNGISQFSQSKGIMKMLNNDNLNIYELDVDKPFAIFIAKPDENSTYDALCGVLVTQLTQHFVKLARKYNGKLPVKLHVILEELGSLGASISNLANLMVASRSRNIRLHIILQSFSQLNDIYGESQAETIRSSIGLTIGFSTNNWDTLTEWSNRCGNRTVYKDGFKYTEPILTPNQIAAMPIATALVMIQGKYKFVCKFPFVEEKLQPVNLPVPNRNVPIKTFDIKKVVDKYREMKREELFDSQFKHNNLFEKASTDEDDSTQIEISDIMKHLHNEDEDTVKGNILDFENDLTDEDFDELFSLIDKKLEELDEEEEPKE